MPPDHVVVLEIDNPPVNALGPAAIAPLIAALAAADADAEVRAIVLGGAGGTFSGGADMRGFAVDPPPRPHVRDLIEAIEQASKPVVAALDGNALGGGLEVALACDYRVAAPDARLGLPEITRGLIPGAGGTQRLPRLIGVGAALPIVLSGEPVDGRAARALGIVDAIADGDVRAAARAFAASCAGERRRASAMRASPDDAALAAARARANPPERGGLAEHAAIDALADATALPFAEGLARERERFLALRESEQSRARIHVFFAEREAGKLADGSVPAPFVARSATVVGAGTMGTGIATAIANAGIAVTLVDLQPALLERARSIIASNYAARVRKGRLTQAQMDERLGRIAYACALDAAAGVDLVIEAVFEELATKQDVFRALDAIAAPHAILATNTSTLDIEAIASATSRPEQVVGMHFFSPANVMRLLEIVRGARTSPAVIAQALGVAKQLKKIGVVAGNCDGFIGNRMLHGYLREAAFLLEEGATPRQVDRAIRAFGFPMGPFAMSDLAGLDVGWRIRKGKHALAPPIGRYSRIADLLCERGRFGQKTGAGYYRYAEGDRTPQPDSEVDALIAQVAKDEGIARRAIGDDEIVERCLYPLVNEGAAILAGGIAARPGDIDVVWVDGYGFPAFRGGPLRWADHVGLAAILARIDAYARTHGAPWNATPLLRELAARGATFAAWNARVRALSGTEGTR
ncbi:crotonase [Vulcanimicrobium alpinum]|uniref:Crotonase n=1 Tax=Vulcanimicrobium alpinum TaxID=3016050 RepID=A0AAN2CB57_UNVUL|nr:3-hydroxyacyl-CoA dehydrogenase NAD-binding domain-containing protein [Vulcanimicrobium alpinum]BDE07871.1 crotonase [Vulcanimicrobium alpinum]